MPRLFRYSPRGSMGRRNLPCSTVKAHTEKSIGARFESSRSASSMVKESFPPDRATATRSPSLIMRKRRIASPTFRNNVFSISTTLIIPAAAQGRARLHEVELLNYANPGYAMRNSRHGERNKKDCDAMESWVGDGS